MSKRNTILLSILFFVLTGITCGLAQHYANDTFRHYALSCAGLLSIVGMCRFLYLSTDGK